MDFKSTNLISDNLEKNEKTARYLKGGSSGDKDTVAKGSSTEFK